MRLEIVDQNGNNLITRNNTKFIPSLGDEIWFEDKWYIITDKTFFYREEGLDTVHMFSKLIEG